MMKTYFYFAVLPLLLASTLSVASPPEDEIIGTWELDAALTKQLAKAPIDPLPEYQTDYIVYSEAGSILDITVKRRAGETNDDVCHFTMRFDGKVTTEYCASKGKQAIDKIITKRVNAKNYQFKNGDPKSKTNWTGSFEVSQDGSQLIVSFDIPGRKTKYFKVFRRKARFGS